MTVSETARGARRDVPGNKLGGFAIWIVGAWMTYAALDVMSGWSGLQLLLLTIVLQIVFTLGQSPVWKGRGSVFGYALLAADTLFNFGGVMAFIVDIDKVGSVQAMAATFLQMDSTMPLLLKGVIALFISALIAGLPEYLWKLD